jgi:hypothetical protein
LLPKRVSDLQKKYSEILSRSTKKIHSSPTITSGVSSVIDSFEQDYSLCNDDLEPVQSSSDVGPKGSQLYSPVWSPQFPSPDGKGLSALLKESPESSSPSQIEEYSLTRSNLSQLVPEISTPSQILTLVRADIMSALTLKNQRYYVSSDEDWRVFNQYRNGNQVDLTILERHNIPMTVGKFNCLKDGIWLNDEVVNFYMSMLQNYDERKYVTMSDYIKTHSLTIREYRKSHFFNTFLMERLLNTHKEYRFDQVVRWFKKIPNILEYDKLFIPININNTHWTLGVVYIQLKKIVYYCSVHGKGGKYLEGLKRWIKDSYLHYGIRDEDWSQWTFDEDRKCPRQTDGYSCGVFVCMFADFLMDNLPLDFTASDAKVYFRSKIGIDILRGEVSYCNSI